MRGWSLATCCCVSDAVGYVAMGACGLQLSVADSFDEESKHHCACLCSSKSRRPFGPAQRIIMVGYGQMHKQTMRKEWAAFYVDYDLLQLMLQHFIDFPGQMRALERCC